MRRVIQALEQRAVKVAKTELDSLIASASKSIQIFVEDTTEIGEINKALRLFQDITGILRVMQVHGGVLLAKETTDVVRGLVDGNIQRHEEAQDVISRAVMHLQDYLEHVEAGNKDIPLALMPVLNDLRASRDAALLSENVLFFPDLDGIEIPDNNSGATESDTAWLNVLRAKYQKALLACINGKDVETAAAQMCKLCIRLQRNSVEVNAVRLWWVASAFAQSVAITGIPFGASIISIFSSIDRKIKSFIDLGESEFSKDSHYSLVKNILYYIAIAEDRGRIVNKVKQAYLLNGQIPEIKELEKLREEIGGPSSNVLVAVSKAMLEDVAKAKDCIELYIHSEFTDHDYIERLYSGLLKISDTLSMIGIDEYRDKIEVQIAEIELIKSGQEKDIDLSLLSVSEVILEIETCINNFIEYRVNFRSNGNEIEDEFINQKNHSNEHIEALSVALSEALLRLEQTKELLADVVHVAYDKEKCTYAVKNLETISGVVKIVNVHDAIPLIDGISDYISSPKFATDIGSDAPVLHDLADCLVSLQCYFEQIELNVPNSRQILEYSEVALSKLLHDEQDIIEEFGGEEIEQDSYQAVEPQNLGNTDSVDFENELEVLPDLNELMDFDSTDQIENSNYADQALSEYDAIPETNHKLSAAEELELPSINEIDEQESKHFVVLKEDADMEILAVFIEEANQVIEDIHTNWGAWKEDQHQWDSFVEIRRGFHTLKGSGRFSGAELLGEFAWALENLCNKLINKKSTISKDIRELLQLAIDSTPKLINQLNEPETVVDVDVYELIDTASRLSELSNKSEKIEQTNLDDYVVNNESEDKILERELTGIFSAEAVKYLTVLKDALDVQAENQHEVFLNNEVTQAMHNLLGSSRTAGASAVYKLCSPLENIILYLMSQDVNINTQQSSMLRKGMEALVFNLEQFIIHDGEESVDEKLIENINELHLALVNKKDTIEIDEISSDDDHDQLDSAKVESIPEQVDFYRDVDEELCEIFAEEAEDSLSALQSSLQMIEADKLSDDGLSNMSRQLHTLKGSSRMAGFNTIGELSHVTETLVVSLADKRIEFSTEIMALLQKVVDSIHASIEAVQAKKDLHLDGVLINQVMTACGLEALHYESTDPVEESPKPDDVEGLIKEENIPPFVLIENSSDESQEKAIDLEVPKNSSIHNTVVEVMAVEPAEKEKSEVIRVKADTLDELVNEAGEVSILNSQLQQILQTYSFSINEYEQTVSRLNEQLRKLEIETEAQILFKHADDQEKNINLDPLELDRYSDIQQLSRALSESAEDLLNIKEMFQGHGQKWEDILNQQRLVSKHLQDSLLNTRMVKFLSVEPRLQRTVRQTSSELNKDIDLVITGADSDIDRSVLNHIVAPLEHLLRNSIFHGVESAEVREQAGKTKVGNIFIDVKRENAEIIISVSDDGAGIDTGRVKARAFENGLIDENENLNDDEILSLLFKPGFSTAQEVTQVAGRGVGMDVVDREIRNLGGNVSIESNLGEGAKFILRLPFTLAVSQALMVRAGKEIYALSLSGIEGIITLTVSELTNMASLENPSYSYAGQEYSFYHLGSLLDSGGQEFDDESATFPVLLVRVGGLRLALQLEESIGNREIVIKPIASKVMQLQGISGATILADGRVALIIDTPWIAELVKSDPDNVRSINQSMQESVNKETTVMVVDDSITIRKVTTRFLERNNYKAVTAKDGVDALQKLQKMIPDLILLDIEMPRMDGYEMASQVRKDERLKDVPIIMITSRTGDKHRNLALDVGVKHYLGKPYNEAELLKYIEDLQIRPE